LFSLCITVGRRSAMAAASSVEVVSMPALFESTWIKSLGLANRSVRSATWSGVADERGYVTDRAVDFYRQLGSGEIGVIVTGYQYVTTNSRHQRHMIGNCEEAQVEGLSRLATAVHAEGGKIIAQIVHAGARANKDLFSEGDELWGPSAIPDAVSGNLPIEVTHKHIVQLVEAYAAAATRALKAGFDGVQLHGAHGFGINQFLSAACNKRTDAYGGSIDKRYRFLGEVLESMRGAVGKDFPVLIKLSGHDFVEGGLVPEESAQVARRLAEDGIDAIEISAGSAASHEDKRPIRTGILKEDDEAYLADIAAFIKDSVTAPVITVGGIRSLPTIDRILRERKADYVAMARPFIREPHLIRRWKRGDKAKSHCISCGGCFETGFKGLGISCKVEREKKEKKDRNE